MWQLLTFTSQGDPEISATATLTSSTYYYGVAVAPESAEMMGKAGRHADLHADRHQHRSGWRLVQHRAQRQPVDERSADDDRLAGVGVTTTVQVVVSIPLEAAGGELDVAVLTITSQHDPEQFAVATLTSRVPVEDIPGAGVQVDVKFYVSTDQI